MERNFVDGYVEWQANPEITGVNRLPQHATFMPYASFEEAQKAERYASSRCKVLNGKWKFKLYKNYAYRPSDFAQVHYDTHNWDTVQASALGKCRATTKASIAMCVIPGRGTRIFALRQHPPSTTRWAAMLSVSM